MKQAQTCITHMSTTAQCLGACALTTGPCKIWWMYRCTMTCINCSLFLAVNSCTGQRSVCMILRLVCTSPPRQLLYILLRVAPNASHLTEAVDVSVCVGVNMYVLCFKHAICFYVYKDMHMLIWKITVGESMWVSLSPSLLLHCNYT